MGSLRCKSGSRVILRSDEKLSIQVINSLIEHCPALFKAIETVSRNVFSSQQDKKHYILGKDVSNWGVVVQVHSKLEAKLGAMQYIGTQEFTRQVDAVQMNRKKKTTCT